MEQNTFKCIDFFNRYIVEEVVYKETENNNYMPIKVYSRSTLGNKFNEDDTISINRPTFKENLDYVQAGEKNDEDIFNWLKVKINNNDARYLLEKWSTKDINEFAQVIKSFLLERRVI